MNTGMEKIYVRIILIAAALTLISCGKSGILALYDGERKKSPEICVIEIEREVVLMSIDTLTRKYQPISQKYIEVLPGRHTIGVNYKSWKGNSIQPIQLSFDAEGGHNYFVKARAGANYWTAWIIDVALDSLVAGYDDLSKEEHRARLNRSQFRY